MQCTVDISNSTAVVRYGKSALPPSIVTSPPTVGIGVMHSHFGATAPPSSTSVDVQLISTLAQLQ